MSIRTLVKSIQDIMRKDVGVDGDAQRISQLCWMFFLKIIDDQDEELEILDHDYESPIPADLQWRNWAADAEGMTGDGLNDFVNLQLFPTLKNKLNLQGPTGPRALVVHNVFEDAYNYMKSGTLIRQVINKICEIDFNNTDDRHTFGSIYEQILKDLQSAGNAGEFYTPRAVTQFIVNRVDPQLEETVLDPARAEHQDIREIHIGLLNMMPDAALEATERQFFRVIGESNQIAQFYVHLFTLPQLPRGEKTNAHIKKYYESFESIKKEGLDALISWFCQDHRYAY